MEPRRRLTNEAYTMGWICASLLDLAAAKAMMEERHLALRQHPADKNEYTLGRVGEYNIVVVCLPAEQAGAIAAAVAATRMMYSFGKIKFVFMVGTGGGVPNKHNDIRLGDVVVGVPSPGKAAVVQYDFGKDTVNDFELFGSLRPPPPDLLAIVGALRTEHGSEHIQLTNHLSAIDGSFAYPGVEHDLLFNSDYEHPSDSDLICSGCDRGELIQRERKNTEGVVHYGSIGSSNMCMSNTKRRERLRKDLGVLCLETESAGLMNDFPCLAIQGVSNYADSHADATKQWEKYAAATAAAYTTGLLKFMSTNTYIREAESSARGQSAVSTGVYSQPQPALEGDESQRPVLSTPPPNSSETDESFGSSMPSMLKKVFFFHNKYGTRSILLFLCRSDDAWCTISEKLRCGSCGKGFWKSQSHNCAMAGVGVSNSKFKRILELSAYTLTFT
jgi:nucleoside phosphorylase